MYVHPDCGSGYRQCPCPPGISRIVCPARGSTVSVRLFSLGSGELHYPRHIRFPHQAAVRRQCYCAAATLPDGRHAYFVRWDIARRSGSWLPRCSAPYSFRGLRCQAPFPYPHPFQSLSQRRGRDRSHGVQLRGAQEGTVASVCCCFGVLGRILPDIGARRFMHSGLHARRPYRALVVSTGICTGIRGGLHNTAGIDPPNAISLLATIQLLAHRTRSRGGEGFFLLG